MTRRIMIVLGALSLVLVLTAGIVIGAGLYREAGREVQISRSRSLAFLTALAAEAETTGDTGSLRAAIDRYRDLFEERVVVEIGGLRLASDPGPLPAGVEAELARARADLGRADLDALRPFRPEPQFLSRPFGTATQIRGAVLIEVDPALAVARADARLLTLLGVAVLVEGVLLASIVLIARWILRPVRHLSGALGTLGRSERLDPLADEGPPELRELTQQFRGMAEALTSTLDRQRAVLGETSHQLRNALAGVLLRLDVLELSPAADHPARIAELGAELARLEHTLEGMMKLADAEHRIASRRVASVSGAGAGAARADAAGIAAAELARAQHAAAERGIRLSGELPEAELLVRCAPFELEQAVAELIANALKYGRSRVSVTVGLDAGGHGSAAQFPGVQSPAALIRVSDDGEGLTEAELRSVGQRFWRSHRHRSVIGHGLGLSMVERLLSEQGGSLGLSNRDRGGLDAVIRLPLADGDPA